MIICPYSHIPLDKIFDLLLIIRVISDNIFSLIDCTFLNYNISIINRYFYMHQHGEHCNHGQQQNNHQRTKDNTIAQLKRKYMPLYTFLKKNGMKFKSAAVDKHAVEYFRIDQLQQFLDIKKEIIEKNPVIHQMLQSWQNIFIFYKRVQNQPKLKWPQQLEKTKDKKHKETKFAGFNFDTASSSGWMTIVIVLTIITVVLFPIWPYEVKYYIWLLSYYSTIILIGFLVVRLVLYLFISMFGASFWIFPRLLENIQFKQTFIPLYSWTKWEGTNFYNSLSRLLALAIFCYYGYHIYYDPNIVTTNLKITKTMMDDFNEWGISKIKGEKNFSQSALTDYTKMYNQTKEQEIESVQRQQQNQAIL